MDTWDTCDEGDRTAIISTLRRQAEDLGRHARSRERASAYRAAADLLDRETALCDALDAAE